MPENNYFNLACFERNIAILSHNVNYKNIRLLNIQGTREHLALDDQIIKKNT